MTAILDRARSDEPVRVVNDIIMSRTYTLGAARVIERLVQADATGVMHVVNSGMCSWYEFACAIVRLAGVDARVEPVPADAYPSAARRPAFSALSNQHALGLVTSGGIRSWKDALGEYVKRGL